MHELDLGYEEINHLKYIICMYRKETLYFIILCTYLLTNEF